jgi:hypothetical protein
MQDRFFKTGFSVTPYDFLKIAALLFMVTDHVGEYFFPHLTIMRAIGRLSFPIWLFLIGYARSRKLDLPLFIAAFFVMDIDTIAHHHFQTLNILWTIILVRLTLNPVMRLINNSETRLAAISFILLLLVPFTEFYVDYGSLALLIAIAGYLMRNGFGRARALPPLYLATILGIYAFMENTLFHFNMHLQILLWLAIVPLWLGLGFWLPRHQAQPLPASPGQKIISLFSRHTLAFYVIHLTVIDTMLFFRIGH